MTFRAVPPVATARPARASRRVLPALTAIAFAITLAACGKKEEQAGGPPGGAAAMAMPVTAVTMAPTQAPLFVEAVGQTEGAKEVEVRARVGGLLVKRDYEEGAPVHAGQLLFEIDRAPLEASLANAKAAVAQAKARLDQSARELSRLKGLVEQDAASRKEFDDATSTEQLSRAALEAAVAQQREAELNLGYASVTAPVSGLSGRALKTEGNLISTADNLLTTVVQVDPLKVRFAVADSDAAQLPGGRLDPHSVKAVQMVLSNGQVYETKGKLDFSAANIDPKLGTRSMRAAFPNPQGAVLPGEFVRVRLEVGTREGVFRVPQAAVMQTDQGFIVMTVGEGDKVAPRPVQVSGWEGKDWIVVGGLKEGDRVIVDNLMKLRPGAPVKPMAPGEAPAGGAPGAAPAGAQSAAQKG